MKKIIFSVAVIAASFTAFAFKSIDKQVAVDNTLTTKETVVAAGCNEYNETNVTFTKCYKTSTEEPTEPQLPEAEALASL